MFLDEFNYKEITPLYFNDKKEFIDVEEINKNEKKQDIYYILKINDDYVVHPIKNHKLIKKDGYYINKNEIESYMPNMANYETYTSNYINDSRKIFYSDINTSIYIVLSFNYIDYRKYNSLLFILSDKKNNIISYKCKLLAFNSDESNIIIKFNINKNDLEGNYSFLFFLNGILFKNEDILFKKTRIYNISQKIQNDIFKNNILNLYI